MADLEIEMPKWWEWPLILIAIPFAAMAFVCGTIAAIISGSISYKIRIWH